MKLHDFNTCARDAAKIIEQGGTVYQQFTCHWCKSKQTMEDANVFHHKGICENCDRITDILKDGCNFLCTFEIKK